MSIINWFEKYRYQHQLSCIKKNINSIKYMHYNTPKLIFPNILNIKERIRVKDRRTNTPLVFNAEHI